MGGNSFLYFFMEISAKQQIIELIRSSGKILIMTHENPDGDGLGSMLALTLALKKLGKNVTPIYSGSVVNNLSFLPGLELTTTQFGNLEEFVINLDTSTVEIDKLGYKNFQDEKKLKIVIKTKTGSLSSKMVSFEQTEEIADLIITLDMSDLDRLGPLYDDNPNLFYQTPIANIDHHPGNEHFGKINWIELTATSTAEMLVSLLESLSTLNVGPDGKVTSLIDQDIATSLLTGLITDTGSFQNTNTTPKSLTVAAQLVALGARHQEIIKHVFKTKNLSTLHLWGKILSNIREEHAFRFIWSMATLSDFKEVGASNTESSGVIDELLKAVNTVDFVLLLTEREGLLSGSLRGINPDVSVEDIAKLFGGGGHKMAAAFRIAGGNFASHGQMVIDKIRRFQQTRLGQSTDHFQQLSQSLQNSSFPTAALEKLFPPFDVDESELVNPKVIPNIAQPTD